MFPQTPYFLYIYAQARQEESSASMQQPRLVGRSIDQPSISSRLTARLVVWVGSTLVMAGLYLISRTRDPTNGNLMRCNIG
jgi:hypothetical protein